MGGPPTGTGYTHKEVGWANLKAVKEPVMSRLWGELILVRAQWNEQKMDMVAVVSTMVTRWPRNGSFSIQYRCARNERSGGVKKSCVFGMILPDDTNMFRQPLRTSGLKMVKLC